MECVDGIGQSVDALDPATLTKEALKGLNEAVKDLEQRIGDRKNIFNTPV